MGKMNNAMKIAWQGQMGGIVGYDVRGNHYKRSLANHVSNPRTEKQMATRMKFTLVSKFIHALGEVYKVGYKHYNTSKNQRSNFFSQLWAEAVDGLYPSFNIDYRKVKIANGLLPNPYAVLGGQGTGHSATVTWRDNSGVGSAKANDVAIIALYNEDKEESVYTSSAATRADEEGSLTYPDEWAGDTIFIFFAMKDDADTSASEGRFAGTFTAA